MEYGRPAEDDAPPPPPPPPRPAHFKNASDDLISPHPLGSPVTYPSPSPSSNVWSGMALTANQLLAPPKHDSRPFLKLLPEIIERILWLLDADAFASAVLVNRQWYAAAQKLDLYAHHLSRCPSYALTNNVITGPFRNNDLKRLKARFALEVRRNLFQAYMRPRETLVNLISTTANSSAAFPGGEAFRFAFSPNGHTLLALSSSRIFVVDLTSDPIEVKRELKTLRRPLSASITDDGSLLAVLSTKHQANVYAITPEEVKHIQVLVLDNAPRTIALAPEGTVLAAAYEGGVEVFSLAVNALSTDRRAVRCEAVDSLMFSGDGSMLIGSSHSPDEPNAVVITAPFYTENDPNLNNRDIHSRMWTTQILFPNNSSTCSHTALLPSHTESDGNWLFAFDHTLQSYRAVRTDDTRSGVTYFLSPQPSRRYSLPSPSVAPAASASGDLVVAGFTGTGLWLYGVPERVDIAPDMGSVVERNERRHQGRIKLTTATGNVEPLMAYSPSLSSDSFDLVEDDSLAGKVDWRQSIFVKCRHLQGLNGLTAVQWVEKPEGIEVGFLGKRLAVVAPGGVTAFAEEMGEEPMPVDGGRIMLLDFDYAPREGRSRVITIEVGEREPEPLLEQQGNLDTEVLLERRRTVRQTRGRGAPRTGLGRSVTAIGAHSIDRGGNIGERLTRNNLLSVSSPEDAFLDDTGRVRTAIPSHSSPHSPDGLHRAATSTAMTRALYPPRPPLGSPQRTVSGNHVSRRQQMPHESDADNWEPPPPPYKRSPQGGLPVDLQRAVPPRHATEPIPRIAPVTDLPRRSSTTLEGMVNSETQPSREIIDATDPSTRPLPSGGLSESSLDILTEMTHHQQIAGPITPMARFSTPSGTLLSPRSTNSSQSPMRRRPMSHDGSRLPSDSFFSLKATLSRPISVAPPDKSLPTLEITSAQPDHFVVSPLEENNNITLTGPNLQNRLNHPVPPTPTDGDQRMFPPYIPPKLQVGQPLAPALLPQNRDAEPFTLAPPTADQMANLHRRMSQDRQRPFSIAGVGYMPPALQQRNFNVPPSPPRGAWGAAGIPGIPSFNKALNSPQGLARNNSRGSQRSIPLSASAPNLLSQRPRYGRLDTIESIGSGQGQADQTRSRAHSMVQPMSPVGEPSMMMYPDHQPTTSTTTPMTTMMMMMGSPDPRTGKKVKKKQRRPEREPSDSSQDGKKKKGMRCVVM